MLLARILHHFFCHPLIGLLDILSLGNRWLPVWLEDLHEQTAILGFGPDPAPSRPDTIEAIGVMADLPDEYPVLACILPAREGQNAITYIHTPSDAADPNERVLEGLAQLLGEWQAGRDLDRAVERIDRCCDCDCEEECS